MNRPSGRLIHTTPSNVSATFSNGVSRFLNSSAISSAGTSNSEMIDMTLLQCRPIAIHEATMIKLPAIWVLTVDGENLPGFINRRYSCMPSAFMHSKRAIAGIGPESSAPLIIMTSSKPVMILSFSVPLSTSVFPGSFWYCTINGPAAPSIVPPGTFLVKLFSKLAVAGDAHHDVY